MNTHLGEFLNYNDTVLGYDLDSMNLADLEDFESSNKRLVPQVVIVRKTFPKFRKNLKHRIWKLKELGI